MAQRPSLQRPPGQGPPGQGQERQRPPLRGALLDRITQRWVVATGRRLELAPDHWLDGPVGDPAGIGSAWIGQHADRVGAGVEADPNGGLLPDLAALARPGFDPGAVSPPLRDFYEHTARFDLDLWTRWSRWAEPGGRVLQALFSDRLRQLSLPLDPLEVAAGMDSDVLTLRRGQQHLGTVWQRTLRDTGRTVFGGLYGVVAPPLGDGPHVRVVFPLPNGSLTVLLRPSNGPDGRLVLSSRPGGFGADGTYLVVRPDAGPVAWVRRVPLHERFALEVDADGHGRCSHRLALGGAQVLQLRYRMRRR